MSYNVAFDNESYNASCRTLSIHLLNIYLADIKTLKRNMKNIFSAITLAFIHVSSTWTSNHLLQKSLHFAIFSICLRVLKPNLISPEFSEARISENTLYIYKQVLQRGEMLPLENNRNPCVYSNIYMQACTHTHTHF